MVSLTSGPDTQVDTTNYSVRSYYVCDMIWAANDRTGVASGSANSSLTSVGGTVNVVP